MTHGLLDASATALKLYSFGNGIFAIVVNRQATDRKAEAGYNDKRRPQIAVLCAEHGR